MIRRTDANQTAIVKTFRERDFSVLIMSSLGKGAPDIAVGKDGHTYFFEIKDGAKALSKQKLTPAEQLFFESWKGHVSILRSTEDAIKFMKHLGY